MGLIPGSGSADSAASHVFDSIRADPRAHEEGTIRGSKVHVRATPRSRAQTEFVVIEARVSEPRDHLRADLEAALADARTDRGEDALRLDPKLADSDGEGGSHDVQGCSPPACVHRGDGPDPRVPQQDRRTVGDSDGHREAGDAGPQPVAAEGGARKGIPDEVGRSQDVNLATVLLSGAGDGGGAREGPVGEPAHEQSRGGPRRALDRGPAHRFTGLEKTFDNILAHA
jgi:hypothetical protein